MNVDLLRDVTAFEDEVEEEEEKGRRSWPVEGAQRDTSLQPGRERSVIIGETT